MTEAKAERSGSDADRLVLVVDSPRRWKHLPKDVECRDNGFVHTATRSTVPAHSGRWLMKRIVRFGHPQPLIQVMDRTGERRVPVMDSNVEYSVRNRRHGEHRHVTGGDPGSVTVALPPSPPELTPGAARALLALILRADQHRRESKDTPGCWMNAAAQR